eukprot:1153223-Pelagomonas_calceolata.AAC.14
MGAPLLVCLLSRNHFLPYNFEGSILLGVGLPDVLQGGMHTYRKFAYHSACCEKYGQALKGGTGIHTANVCSVQFSPTSPHLVAAGTANCRAYLYDLRKASSPLSTTIHGGWPKGCLSLLFFLAADGIGGSNGVAERLVHGRETGQLCRKNHGSEGALHG